MSTFKQLQQEINERIAEAEDAVIANRLNRAMANMSEVDYIKLKEVSHNAIHADNKVQAGKELHEFLMHKLEINGIQRKREGGDASNTTIE